jgi:hypothetical protein
VAGPAEREGYVTELHVTEPNDTRIEEPAGSIAALAGSRDAGEGAEAGRCRDFIAQLAPDRPG